MRDVDWHYSLIESRIHAFDRYQNQWPWMTLNGVMTADARYLCGSWARSSCLFCRLRKNYNRKILFPHAVPPLGRPSPGFWRDKVILPFLGSILQQKQEKVAIANALQLECRPTLLFWAALGQFCIAHYAQAATSQLPIELLTSPLDSATLFPNRQQGLYFKTDARNKRMTSKTKHRTMSWPLRPRREPKTELLRSRVRA